MKFINIVNKSFVLLLYILAAGLVVSCNDDGMEPTSIEQTGNEKTYNLVAVANSGVSGTVTVAELTDGSLELEVSLTGTPAGGSHPAHIHANTAAETGGIIATLNPVDGTSGTSTTILTTLDDGTAIDYEQMLALDGYINVHLSADDLGTLVAQGDIGQNELTGQMKNYDLEERAVAGISGTATFYERLNGEALAVLSLMNTPDGGSHPAHIHNNSAVEGGGIAFTFNPIDGTTGQSRTNVAALDDGTALTYADILAFDGYINVHLSASELATIVAQGDIGQNELTGQMKSYDLEERAVAGISGTATFHERVSGEALAVISLLNTPDGGSHPAHIHNNSAVEGGGIAFTFNPIDGTTGESKTNIAALDDGTAITYAELLSYDGYINVHLSASELATIVAQGDIGQNELTGVMKSYNLEERAVAGISGTATFHERVSGEALAVISLMNTPDGGSHPAHIHNNSAVEGGGIAFSFNPVDGTTGMSKTHVAALDDGTAITYTDLLSFDGHINVHLSSAELGTIVAQGDIGSNESAGQVINYDVTSSGSSAYIFNGNGLTNSQNPNITLQRGATYTFNINAGGHPFIIKTEQSTGTAGTYSNGVTNNGTENGTITFVVPMDAPNTLFYVCQFHSPMTGTITITN